MTYHPRQPDLFFSDAAGGDWSAPVYRPDPDRVRARLHKILGEVRAGPLDASRALLYRTIFPQMSLCLPEEEAALLRSDFWAALARLEGGAS